MRNVLIISLIFIWPILSQAENIRHIGDALNRVMVESDTRFPMQFPVSPNEVRLDQYGYVTGDRQIVYNPTTASPNVSIPGGTAPANIAAEVTIRNYKGSIADLRTHAPAIAAEIDRWLDDRPGFSLVFVKNQRGFYIPQMVESSRWDPNNPGRTQYARSIATADAVWRKSPHTNRFELVNCPRETGRDQTGAELTATINNSCNAQRPIEPLKCGHDELLAGTGLDFADLKKNGKVDCLSNTAKNNDFLALACNIYFESRGEGTVGKSAVGDVTMNRTRANMGRSGDRNHPRCGPSYAKTVRGVVYEKRWNSRKNRCEAQFSWTTSGNAVVRFDENDVREQSDRSAWLESLYQAMTKYQLDDNGVPVPSQGPLGCYTHYLSLNKYDSYEDLLAWAKTYTNESGNLGANIKPLCIGAHVFFRNTDDEYACTPPEIFRDPEAGDKEMVYRNRFFEDCLKTDAIMGTPSPGQPNSKLCASNNLDAVICAQTNESPGLTIGGMPITCGDDGKLIIPTGPVSE